MSGTIQLSPGVTTPANIPADLPGLNLETHDNFTDLLNFTLNQLGPMKFSDLASKVTDYEVMPRILRKDRVEHIVGPGLVKNVMTSHSKVARHAGLFANDEVAIPEILDRLSVPIRHTTTHWSYDRREVNLNGDGTYQQLVDVIQSRRIDALLSLVELMEATFWGAAVDASSDKLTPFTINNWLAPSNGTTKPDGQFTAGVAADYIQGGLTATRWANWADRYAGLTVSSLRDGLVRQMRKAHRKIQFRSPVDIPDYRGGTGQNYKIYVNEATIAAFESLAEIQNDSLGSDVAPMDGQATFRKNPFQYVPLLDETQTEANYDDLFNTTNNSGVAHSNLKNPIYFINWNVLGAFFLKGEFLRDSGAIRRSSAHNVYQNHTDLSWNTYCSNRRKLAIFTDST